jgi:hypothetical protein
MRCLPVLAMFGLLIASQTVRAQGFHLLDNGTATRQVVADGPRTFVLKDNGNVWSLENGQWTQVDNGTGTPMIAASSGFLYAQKDDGSVWLRKLGQWTKIGKEGTRQMVADSAFMYTLETNNIAYLYNANKNTWTQIDSAAGSRMLAADTSAQNVVLYCLKENGNIFQYLGQNVFNQGQWTMVDDGSGTKAITAGGGMLYALKDNGNIWRKNGSWGQIDNGTGTKQLVADGKYLFALKENGNIWMFRDEQWVRIDDGTGTKAIDAHGGRVLVLKDNGNIFEGFADTLGLTHASRVANFRQLHGK